MATFQLPWNLDLVGTWQGTVSHDTSSGFVTEQVKDERPLVRRTPRGKWRPPTPYYRVVWTGSNNTYDSSVYWKYYSPTYPNEYGEIIRTGANWVSGYYATSMPAPPNNMESRAIIKARLKLKGMKINLPQAFAERSQTVRLVEGNLRQLIGMVEGVHRLKPGRWLRKDMLRGDWLFDRWLELQYGWKPLLSDVLGACQHLAETELRADWPPCTVKSVIREKDRVVTPLTESVNILKFDLEKIEDVEHKAMIRLDFEPDLAPQGLAAELGITNPLELAWELLPWSFVADWFIPVGDYLSSLDATVGWRFKGGSYSVKTDTKVRARVVRVIPDPSMRTLVGPYVTINGSGRRMQFTRTTYSSAPLPTLPSLAQWDKSSVLHVANGIALLRTAIAGGVRVR